jgi:hypothetical protein
VGTEEKEGDSFVNRTSSARAGIALWHEICLRRDAGFVLRYEFKPGLEASRWCPAGGIDRVHIARILS